MVDPALKTDANDLDYDGAPAEIEKVGADPEIKLLLILYVPNLLALTVTL